MRIYIYIYIFIYLFIYHHCFLVFVDLLDSFNLENVWYRSIKSWKMFHHAFCNNCLQFWRLRKFFFFWILFLIFFFLKVKTWKVKYYSLPFFLLPICNGKYLRRIEHSKRIKQGQDCQKVIAKKSLRNYIYIYIYLYLSPLFFQSMIC